MTYKYRKDGWPLCPRCGEDELASTDPRNLGILKIGGVIRKPEATDEMRCYMCAWTGRVPRAVEETRNESA